uniref:Large ribosomal subunit protein uL13 n=1 Tax=Candidatus Methanophagaceae archaeon ANME-1 ERB6 TaxID=2759912 RepID=A0A7G9YWD1_9EURY|nr:50S ribosomal protein L13 [Methanosarcinales archaeon ANME-1 ERB6]
MEIINGEGLILGRLASEVAKQLLKEKDKEIAIVNAEHVVISGSKVGLFEEYKTRKNRGSKEQGPYFPTMPDRIVKRTIRGMLPYKRARGRDALSRVKVYLGIPDEYEGKASKKVESANAETRLSLGKYITLEEVSGKLGWEPKRR